MYTKLKSPAMKSHSYIYLWIFLFTFKGAQLSAITDLRVLHPQRNTNRAGTIEQAVIAIKPAGMFVEYGVYLTFSARGASGFQANDSLEIIYRFDLPTNATCIDSWLWIGDDIVQGEVLDVWSATRIYEGIVNRREDPSILRKTSATQYELRVYPMKANETRKVKITFLMPASFEGRHMRTNLPLYLLRATANSLPGATLLFQEIQGFIQPEILNSTVHTFETIQDENFPEHRRTTLRPSDIQGSLQLRYSVPTINGMYYGEFKDGLDTYYQLAVLPNAFFEREPKKMVFVMDYELSKSSFSKTEMIAAVRNALKSNLSPLDSFNIIFSNVLPDVVATHWVPAIPDSIDFYFDQFSSRLSNSPNLATSISRAVAYINQNPGATIHVVSCSQQFISESIANATINEILDLMTNRIPIFIADAQDLSFTVYSIRGRQYRGNEYFYSNLAFLTKGFYVRRYLTNLSIADMTMHNIVHVSSPVQSIELQSNAPNGLVFARYQVPDPSSLFGAHSPIMQVGKRRGQLPMNVQLSGLHRDTFFNHSLQIPPEFAEAEVPLTRKAWVMQDILFQESRAFNQFLTDLIIVQSIEERVQSLYTAFLCLEEGAIHCASCLDETLISSIEEKWLQNDSTIIVMPNPFIDKVQVVINTFKGLDLQKLNIQILDVQGKTIAQIPNETLLSSGQQLMFTWNAGNASPGIYFVVMQYKGRSLSRKLIKM
jgi:hypothetical protein